MTRIKTIAAVMLIGLSVSGYAQKSSPKPITDRDYYEFYNSVPQPYKLRRFVLLSEPERFDTFNSLFEQKGKMLDTLFPKSDSTFLKQQISKAANFFWGPGMIDGSKVVNKADIDALFNGDIEDGWGRFDKMYGVGGYCQYSVPLFSTDGQLCIILCSEACGSLCGEGDVYYYKKVNGKWQIVYHYMRWIS